MDMDNEDNDGAEEENLDTGEIPRTLQILSHISGWSRRNIAHSFKS